jgi:translocation and assembly module TamB
MLVSLQQQDLTSGGLTEIGPGLEPDLELSLEWSTPFFMLEWSFLPKHPENLFLSDNSLSFSWRYSY